MPVPRSPSKPGRTDAGQPAVSGFPLKKTLLPLLISVVAAAAIPFCSVAGTVPDKDLRVVIIRHGEKPDSGDNLSCQGQNRALQLPDVLYRKFGIPGHVYVPAIGVRKSNDHVRMFETIIPFAVKHGLTINSEFELDAYPAIAQRVLGKTGTVLMVWQHDAIPALAAQLGVDTPPKWKDKDFDSIWIITFAGGKAALAIDREALSPSATCSF